MRIFEYIITEIGNNMENEKKENLVFIEISDDPENVVLKSDNKLIELKNKKGILI